MKRIFIATTALLLSTSNAFALPCATTYEVYREKLISDGYQPIGCKKLKRKSLVWDELCVMDDDKGELKGLYASTWIDADNKNEYDIPVLFSHKKGLCVFSAFIKNVRKRKLLNL